jgi:undecaprenyl-diphosphatase
MNIGLLKSILYGLVCGFAEFLPVSSQAHRSILNSLFGVRQEEPLMVMFLHIGALLALVVSSRSLLQKLQRELEVKRVARRRSRRQPDELAILDMSLVKTASIVMLLGLVFCFKASAWNGDLPMIALFLVINGIVLHVPLYLPKGNKDARTMSRLDAVLLGIGNALSIVPGISRIGASVSIGISRGATPQNAYKWSLLISIPALAALVALDLFSVVTAGLGRLDFSFLLQCIICGCAAYIGATGGISLMKNIVYRSGIENFSYYCWGASLFTFILYMI